MVISPDLKLCSSSLKSPESISKHLPDVTLNGLTGLTLVWQKRVRAVFTTSVEMLSFPILQLSSPQLVFQQLIQLQQQQQQQLLRAHRPALSSPALSPGHSSLHLFPKVIYQKKFLQINSFILCILCVLSHHFEIEGTAGALYN